MNRRKNKKKTALKLTAVLCVGIILFGIISVCISPKMRYIASDRLSHISSGAKLEKTSSLDFESYTLSELLDNEKVEFNYNLMLINEDFPLTAEPENELCDYKDLGIIMDENLSEPFSRLADAVLQKFDSTLYISSSFRTAEEQAQMKAEEGDTAQSVGASEHQAGLALDVYVQYFAGSGFIKSEAGQFVNKSCSDYGFIIRYPYYGKSVTGIGYEPWHIRFVGKPHADIISKNSTTLEEYIDSLEPGEFYTYDGYVISRQSEKGEIKLPQKFKSASVSPDNTGNYIVTVTL